MYSSLYVDFLLPMVGEQARGFALEGFGSCYYSYDYYDYYY